MANRMASRYFIWFDKPVEKFKPQIVSAFEKNKIKAGGEIKINVA